MAKPNNRELLAAAADKLIESCQKMDILNSAINKLKAQVAEVQSEQMQIAHIIALIAKGEDAGDGLGLDEPSEFDPKETAAKADSYLDNNGHRVFLGDFVLITMDKDGFRTDIKWVGRVTKITPARSYVFLTHPEKKQFNPRKIAGIEYDTFRAFKNTQKVVCNNEGKYSLYRPTATKSAPADIKQPAAKQPGAKQPTAKPTAEPTAKQPTAKQPDEPAAKKPAANTQPSAKAYTEYDPMDVDSTLLGNLAKGVKTVFDTSLRGANPFVGSPKDHFVKDGWSADDDVSSIDLDD